MYDEYEDYGYLDPEGPGPEDLARFDRRDEEGGGTVKCQECGRDIFDDSDVCPYCGAFQIHSKRRSNKSRWIAIVAILTLLAFLLVYVL